MTPELIIMLLIINELVGRPVFALLGKLHIIRCDPCSKNEVWSFRILCYPFVGKSLSCLAKRRSLQGRKWIYYLRRLPSLFLSFLSSDANCDNFVCRHIGLWICVHGQTQVCVLQRRCQTRLQWLVPLWVAGDWHLLRQWEATRQCFISSLQPSKSNLQRYFFNVD